jgi:hypothetical protein
MNFDGPPTASSSLREKSTRRAAELLACFHDFTAQEKNLKIYVELLPVIA